MNPSELTLPHEVRMPILDGETESEMDASQQVTEDTVWAKTQRQGCPTSSLLVPNYASRHLGRMN